MTFPLTLVDAFADAPFRGNPAAVCLLDAPAEEAWMQSVAAEMNQAETAFLVPQGGSEYGLRWFTPTAEVDLCGHATLASAHFLWEAGHLPVSETARFHTKSGLLTAARAGEWITLDFPATPLRPVDAPPGLEAALGLSAVWVGQTSFDYLVEAESEAVVRALTPDFARLLAIEARGVIVTARSAAPEYAFVSRFFCPSVGINEDPVTGSAHCALAPYWAGKLGKTSMIGYQASRRGGVVKAELRGDRVLLSGQAVTTLRGELS